MCHGNVIWLIIILSINLIFATFTDEEFSININDANPDILNQAYVQTGSELYYFKDISYQDNFNRALFQSENNNNKDTLDTKQKSSKYVQLFSKDTTDFGRTSFGIPVHRIINIYNPSGTDILLESLFNIGEDFHCSFLGEELLHAKQQTSFHVYFLPKSDEPALREEIIILQTSIGKSVHTVRGEVLGNPFKIKPYLGLHIPLNTTFSAPIQLHNPHATCMYILEIFTSDCHLEVELATSDEETAADLLFEPFETREIAVAKIMGDTERNTTTFIFIRITLEGEEASSGQRSGQISHSSHFTIIIPIETQVTRQRGLFTTNHMLDFGLLRAGELSNPQKLHIFSTLEKSIDIESVSVDNPQGIYFQFGMRPPISIKSGARGQPGAPIEVASVNIDTKEREEERVHFFRGKMSRRQGLIIAESRGGNYNLTIPFRADIYKGGVLHSPEEISFHERQLLPVARDVVLTNTLPYGLAIYSIGLDDAAKNAFKVSLISNVVLLSSGQSSPVFTIHYIKRVEPNFISNVFLHTNMSVFQVPFSVFHGGLKVELHSREQDRFEFGTVTYGESRSILFNLTNPNPVNILIKSFYSPPQISFNFIGMKRKREEEPVDEVLQNEMPNSIPANSTASFRITLSVGAFDQSISEHTTNQSVVFSTQFATYKYPIHFQLINSTALLSVPRRIVFHDAFVGAILTQPLMVLNKISKSLRLLRISISDGDPRFLLSLNNSSQKAIDIQPKALTNVANLTFRPDAACPQGCYLGMPLTSSDGQWFAYGMKLPQNLAEIDHYLYGKLRAKWLEVNDKLVQSTINLDTDVLRGLEIPVEAKLIWPRLLDHPIVHFPLTAVGNFSIVNLTLTNPSSIASIVVQLLPLVIYPDADSFLDFFHTELPAPLIDPIELNETLMFSLRDTELFTLKAGSPVPNLRDEVEKIVEGPLPRFTLSLLLRPRTSARIRIGFLPSDYSLRSSLLVIRNNLTALEPVVLYGRGAIINMEIDNKTARTQPLLFELEAVHLADCTNPRRQLHKMPTTLTVKKSFAIRNNGEVGFSVTNISVNGIPCESRGYRVINCDRFRLEPNETTYLDIAFTPDFLFSVSEATLQLFVHMNGTPWSFDMAAVIPRHLLSVCYSALPRPPFEALMYQTCVLALSFCFICIISCAYLEGDRVIMCAYKHQYLQEQEYEVFDLNAPDPPDRSSLEIGKVIADMQKRKFIQMSAEAGAFERLFWRITNFVLWTFSHIWPLFRGEKASLTGRKQRKHLPVQNCVSTKDDVPPVREYQNGEDKNRQSKKKANLKLPNNNAKAVPNIFEKLKENNNWGNKSIDGRSSVNEYSVSGGTNGCEVNGFSRDDENSNDLDDDDDEFSETYHNKKESSEESDLPEWADDTALEGNNADDGLDTLAEQSAALFDNISDTDRERFSPSEGNSSGTEPDESVNESGEEEEGTSEDTENERIISKLTREYRQRLRKIMRNGKFTDGLFTIPFEINSGMADAKTSKCGSLPSKRPFNTDTKPLDTSSGWNRDQNRAGFLFDINDPVWKPIGEFDEKLTPEWPVLDTRNGV